MSLCGNGSGSRAIESQLVTVAGGDQNKEHALRIVVAKGNLHVRVGTTLGDDSYIGLNDLDPGTYSLAFTPTGNFYIQLTSNDGYTCLVDSVNIESSGAVTLPTPWLTADLPNIRYDQSEDVIYLACQNYAQYKIERPGNARSWAILQYVTYDGPFQNINADISIQLAVAALTGDTTMSSTIPFFKAGHVGALFRSTSAGQTITGTPAGANQFTNPIEVTGVGTSRFLNIAASGTYSGTWSIQRSVGDTSNWTTIQTGTTSATLVGFNDTFDNQIMFYRVGFESGNYTSGTLNVTMSIPSGGITGIARVTCFNSSTSVNIEVLTSFGATTATDLWSQGKWSTVNGFPTSNAFYEGRLWWFGNDAIDGSVSDAFGSYDDTILGTSAPISRSIGSGPVENICWGKGIQRLLLGGEDGEFSVRSSYLDEPLTTTDFNIKSPSSRGSAKVAALKIDSNLLFVQRGDVDTGNNQYGPRLIEMSYQGNYAIVDYASDDLSKYAPELTSIGILKIVSQRKIDTRIHCILTDGTVAICIYDPIEKLKCWVLYQTQGDVEDIIVMPGGIEDKVYYVVIRTINNQTVRCLEKWALESECVGGQINKNADCHTVIQNMSPSTTISVPHLAGATVVVWADGFDIGTKADRTQTYTLDGSGNATVPSYTNAVVGLGYTAQFQSTKLAYGASPNGTALTQVKSVDKLGLILANTHSQGIQYGPDFNSLDEMPQVEDGAAYATGTIWDSYDKEAFDFDGKWVADSRVCLQSMAPRPANILAAVISLTTSEQT